MKFSGSERDLNKYGAIKLRWGKYVNFDLSDDELMLKALAERFVEDRYEWEKRREYLAAPVGFDGKNWSLLGEIGLIAAFFNEESGGLAIDDSSISVLFQALGRGLVIEPLIDNALLAGTLFEALSSDDQKSEWMDSLLMGEARFALAHYEGEARGDANRVATTATESSDHFQLNGSKSLIAGGAGVDAYLVSAVSGPDEDPSIYLVSADAPGLSIRNVRTIDGAVSVALTLDGVQVTKAARLSPMSGTFERVLARSELARCAESLGIMEAMFEETCNYLRERDQFGSPLSQFQALQHRMVEQYAVIEQARALLDLAVMADAEDKIGRIAGARSFIGEKSVIFGHEMVQMHGAMGVSDELWIGSAHKRLFWNSRYPAHHDLALDTYSELVG